MHTRIARQFFIAAVALTGINFLSSCESCNRKEGDTKTTETTVDGMDDTYSNDTIMGAENSGTGSNATGSYSGSRKGSSGSNNTGTPAGNSQSGSVNATAPASGGTNSTDNASKGNSTDYSPKNDPVENSNYYRNKKAGSVESGGTAGSGQGTGTGTTGNNSRVSDPRDQKN